MSIILPGRGYLVGGPITQIQPFTYEDGITFTELLYALKEYLEKVLLPYVNGIGDDVNEAIAAMIEYVNNAIEQIINNSIEVQDPVVAGIVNDPDSATRAALDARYGLKTVLDSIETLIESGRLSQANLDAAYAAKSAVDALNTLVTTGRLSETALEKAYGSKYPIVFDTPFAMNGTNIALGRAISGGAPFKVFIVGDSTGQGYQSVQKSYPNYLITALSGKGIPAKPGIIAPAKSIPDSRWAALPGWDISNEVGPAGGTWQSAAGNTNALFYRPSAPHTSITIHYLRQAGGGKFTIDHNGTVLGTIDTGVGTPNTYASSTFAVVGTAANAGAISGVTGGRVNILGFEYADSNRATIAEVSNFSQNGVSAADWVDIPLSLAAIDYYKPDFTCFCLGINDAQELRPVNVFMDKVNNIVSRARKYGDVVIFGFPMSAPDAFPPAAMELEAAYIVALKNYADTNNLPFFDFNKRSGGYSDYTTNPWYNDKVHQSTEANGSIALVVANLLAS